MMRAIALIGLMTFLPVSQAAPPKPVPAKPLPSPDTRPYSLKGKSWLGRRLSVMVVFATECKPCVESIPFYKRLSELPSLDGTDGKLIVWTQGGAWPVNDIIEAHPQKFIPHDTVSFPMGRYEVKGVPTIVLVDGDGRRIGEWPGKLTAVQEQRVVAAISAAASKR